MHRDIYIYIYRPQEFSISRGLWALLPKDGESNVEEHGEVQAVIMYSVLYGVRFLEITRPFEGVLRTGIVQTMVYIWEILEIRGTFLGGPHKKDKSILGSILGSPYFGKLPFAWGIVRHRLHFCAVYQGGSR